MQSMKENRERRKSGQIIVKKNLVKDETEIAPPILSNPAEQNKTKGYQYFQSQVQNQLAYFQAERFGQIASDARKEKHILYKFDEDPKPPKLGEKKNSKDKLIPIEVYYNEIPNSLHIKLDNMRSKVQDLTYVKSLQSPSMDPEGNAIPAVLNRNDKNITGVSDIVFAHINEEIDKRNKEIAALMAYWMYGIDEKLLPHLETASLANALECGLYREMYGIVQSSKNLAVS